MKDLTGTHKTVIIVAFLAAVVALSFFDKDTAGVLTFGGVLLGGLGIGAVVTGQSAIKDQVNGRMSTMLGMLEGVMHRLAEAPALPPREPDPPQDRAGSSR